MLPDGRCREASSISNPWSANHSLKAPGGEGQQTDWEFSLLSFGRSSILAGSTDAARCNRLIARGAFIASCSRLRLVPRHPLQGSWAALFFRRNGFIPSCGRLRFLGYLPSRFTRCGFRHLDFGACFAQFADSFQNTVPPSAAACSAC